MSKEGSVDEHILNTLPEKLSAPSLTSSKKSGASSSSKSIPKPTPAYTDASASSAELEIEEHIEEDPEKIAMLSQRIKTYIWPTLSDYGRKLLKTDPLFDEILKHEDLDQFLSSKTDEEMSMLITGFGLRNVQSLQDALNADERTRLLQLYVKKLKEEREKDRMEMRRRKLSSSSGSRKSSSRSSDTITQTDVTTTKSDISQEKKQLDYLLGLEAGQDEAQEDEPPAFGKPRARMGGEEAQPSLSKNMREAQKYLRTHRIFEFFNFMTTHLLSACPDNPIEFILNLLNECLMYRSGLGSAPLLYEKKHIEQLFSLMDRMKSGSVEYEQYVVAMNTLGICSYNKFPNANSDARISKDVFVEEIYEAEVELFEDLIKRRRSPTKQAVEICYSTPTISQASDRGPYFIPSELFKFRKKESEKLEIKEEKEYDEWGG